MNKAEYTNNEGKELWKVMLEERMGKRITKVYRYGYPSGDYAYSKVKFEDGSIVNGFLEEEGFQFADSLDIEMSVGLYGAAEKMEEAIEAGRIIYIVEGEEACDCVNATGRVAVSYGNAGAWYSILAIYFTDAKVIILPTYTDAGIQTATAVKRDLLKFAQDSRVVVPLKEHGCGIKEYLDTGGRMDTVDRMNEYVDYKTVIQPVCRLLKYQKDGTSKKVAQLVENIKIVLEHDPRLAGKIRYNRFNNRLEVVGSLPWDYRNIKRQWKTVDGAQLFSLIQSDYGLKNRADYNEALEIVANAHAYHPVKDWLEQISWDGKEHIRTLLPDYLGAEDTDYQYYVMRHFLLGAVSRIYEPGCKFDEMIVLVGPQGCGKSTFLNRLAVRNEWFTDAVTTLDSKTAAEIIAGKWIAELAELTAFSTTKGGDSAIKQFVSAPEDRFRPAYARRAESFPRQIVFAGTTNHKEFLTDETGGRRFLILMVSEQPAAKDLFGDTVAYDVEQAWAQAVHIYKTERPELKLPAEIEAIARSMQAACRVDDVRVGLIAQYLEDSQKDKVCAAELWDNALNHRNLQMSNGMARELNQIMDNMPGWERLKSSTRFDGYGSQRGFRRIRDESAKREFCNKATM